MQVLASPCLSSVTRGWRDGKKEVPPPKPKHTPLSSHRIFHFTIAWPSVTNSPAARLEAWASSSRGWGLLRSGFWDSRGILSNAVGGSHTKQRHSTAMRHHAHSGCRMLAPQRLELTWCCFEPHVCTDFLGFFVFQVPGSVGSSLRSPENREYKPACDSGRIIYALLWGCPGSSSCTVLRSSPRSMPSRCCGRSLAP